jgi:hypothetical protein
LNHHCRDHTGEHRKTNPVAGSRERSFASERGNIRDNRGDDRPYAAFILPALGLDPLLGVLNAEITRHGDTGNGG